MLRGAPSRAAPITAIVCTLLSTSTLGCRPALEQFTTDLIAYAPNRGRSLPSGPEPGEIRVPVGPPPATLSIEIVGAANTRGTIFVLHGIRSDKRSARPWSDMLVAAGYRAVLVDLRGHGRSTGNYLTYGVVDSRDLVQTLTLVEKLGLRVGPVGVMGYSYGAATAIEWAAIDPRVQAVVAVAPFDTLHDVATGYLSMLPTTVVDEAIADAGRLGGFDPSDASPANVIAHTAAPVLLIHGLADRRIPSWHSVRIFDARRDRTTLVLVEGADHDSITVDPAISANAPSWFARSFEPSAHAARSP